MESSLQRENSKALQCMGKAGLVCVCVRVCVCVHVRACLCMSVHVAYGVMVSMFDFHRSDGGSNPGRGGKISCLRLHYRAAHLASV